MASFSDWRGIPSHLTHRGKNAMLSVTKGMNIVGVEQIVQKLLFIVQDI